MTYQEIVREVATKVLEFNEGYASSEPKTPLQWLKDGGATPYMVKKSWHGYKVFNPISNLNHAFMVVERMLELGWHCQIWQYVAGDWGVSFAQLDGTRYEWGHPNLGQAICLAALKALEGK